MSIHPHTVGIDVSKHHLDVFDSRSGAALRIDNTAAALLERVGGWTGAFVLFEATGEYDRTLRTALASAGVIHARVNPGRARDFARAAGFLAKTDAVDARMLAAMAAALKPPADDPADRDRERLAELVKRRDQLVAMRASERTRASESTDPEMRADIDLHLDWLDERIAHLEKAIKAHAGASPRLGEDIALMRSAPGIGPVAGCVLAACLPELGRRSPKTIAALAGLAPLNADSGMKRGQRSIRGGRKRVRDALYMAALAAVRCSPRFAAFYKRLRDAGKAPKLALVAVARKLLTALNAMMRDRREFA